MLEPIPVNNKAYTNNTKMALTAHRDQKLVTCHTIFYFQDQLLETSGDKNYSSKSSLICKYFQHFTIYLRNENPHFVLFITFADFSSLKYYICLRNIDVTSSFYRLSAHKVDRIDPSTLIVAYPNLVHAYFGIWHGWRWDKQQRNSFYDCAVSMEPLFSKSYPYFQYCLFRLAKQILNITESAGQYHTDVTYGVANFSSVNNIVKLFDSKNMHLRYQPVSYGMKVTFYQFGIVTRPLNYDLSSLAKPLDILTWSFLMGSILCLCLYFRIIFQLTNQRGFPLLEIHVVSVLLEQSQDIVTHCKFLRKQTCLLLISLMLLTFLVGNAYKGVLYTILTTPSIPSVPKTLQQVIDSNISVVSTRGVLYKTRDWGYFMESDIRKHVHALLSNADKKLGNSTLYLYEKLNERTSLTLVNISNLFISMKTGVEVEGLFKEHKNHTIRENIFILNPEDDLRLVKELYRIFTTNVFVLGDKLNLLSEQKQWAIRRNNFLTSFLPILSGLIESGIYNRWEYFETVLSTFRVYWATRKKLVQGSIGKLSSNDNILAYLLFKPYTDKRSLNTEQPITLSFFAVFASLFGYCVMFCSIVFLIEKLSRIEIAKLYRVTLDKMVKFYHAFIHAIFIVWLHATMHCLLALTICTSWTNEKAMLWLEQLSKM